MPITSSIFNFRNLLLAGLLLASVAILLVDIQSTMGLAGGIPYALVVMGTYWIKQRRYTVASGVLATFFIIAGFFYSEPSEYFTLGIANRLMTIAVIWGTVWFVVQYKNSLNEIRKNEKRITALFEAATEGMIITDLDGKIVMINSKVEELFGYSREELIGEKFELLVPSRFESGHEHYRDTYYNNPEPRNMGEGRDLYGLKKNGEKFPLEISLNHFETDEGRFVISYVVDITERKETEDELLETHKELKRKAVELKQSNQELEQFAYVASHDLQEPLRMVASYTQLLSRRYKGQLDDDANDFIDYAVNGARRMQKLLNNLLQFSRVGTRAKPFEPNDLDEIIEDAIQNLERVVEENNARINRVTDMPVLSVDKMQITQLFQNLIHNAIKFKKDEVPKVWIQAENQKDHWQFCVSDNGIGIDQKHQERIFVIFQQLQNRDAQTGSGIGLAICKKIVERHGGEIWVDSEPGEGAYFYFTIAKGLETPQEEKVKDAIEEDLLNDN